MKLLGRKKKEKEVEAPPESEEVKPRRREKRVEQIDKPRDPTRWLSLIFLLIFLFISYLSWVAYQL